MKSIFYLNYNCINNHVKSKRRKIKVEQAEGAKRFRSESRHDGGTRPNHPLKLTLSPFRKPRNDPLKVPQSILEKRQIILRPNRHQHSRWPCPQHGNHPCRASSVNPTHLRETPGATADLRFALCPDLQ